MDSFSEYLLVAPFGESSHASVFLSYNKTHRRFCVLKLFNKYSENFQQQSLREEYEIYQKLAELNIEVAPNFYNFGTDTRMIKNLGDNKTPYGFLELEFGYYGDLLNIVKKYHELENRMGLPENVAKFFFWQIIMMIDTMHSKKMAHLDIKPENIVIQRDLSIKFIDFGFTQRVPLTGLVYGNRGTKGFQAPESKEMGLYEACKADIYSAGISLWQIVAPCVPLRDIDGRVSRACASLIRGMINSNPKKRLDLEQVKNHEWFTEIEDNEMIKERFNPFFDRVCILNSDNLLVEDDEVREVIRKQLQSQDQSVEGSEGDVEEMCSSDSAPETAQPSISGLQSSEMMYEEQSSEAPATIIGQDSQFERSQGSCLSLLMVHRQKSRCSEL